MKIVINNEVGGFGISNTAADRIGWTYDKEYYEESGTIDPPTYRIDRANPLLVAAVEELGEQVNDEYAHLELVEIPDGSFYEVVECDDGREYVLWSATPISTMWGANITVSELD